MTTPNSLIRCGGGGAAASVVFETAPVDWVGGGLSPHRSGMLNHVLLPGVSGLDFALSITVTVAIWKPLISFKY